MMCLHSDMVRTQIQLSESQARRVRAVAQQEGISMAEGIRRCVDAALEDENHDLDELYARALSMAGSLEDPEGATDLAERHDDYLDEAYGSFLDRR